MVHGFGFVGRCPEWDRCHGDISSWTAAGDAFEQAENVQSSLDPAIGHGRGQPIRDERTGRDTVGSSQGEVRPERSMIGLPASSDQRFVELGRQPCELVCARDDSDPERSRSTVLWEGPGTAKLEIDRAWRR
jgi:hypothetical protein